MLKSGVRRGSNTGLSQYLFRTFHKGSSNLGVNSNFEALGCHLAPAREPGLRGAIRKNGLTFPFSFRCGGSTTGDLGMFGGSSESAALRTAPASTSSSLMCCLPKLDECRITTETLTGDKSHTSSHLPVEGIAAVTVKEGKPVAGFSFIASAQTGDTVFQGHGATQGTYRSQHNLFSSLQNRLMHWPGMDLVTSCSPPVHLQQRRTFIQLRSSLMVADNSGAKRVQCIQVLRGGRTGRLGDLIIASVKDAVPRGKVKKGEVVNCVIVRTAMQRQRSDGSEIKFDGNAVVLVNKQGEPLGTRIFGPVPHELRQRKYVKILTLAEHVA